MGAISDIVTLCDAKGNYSTFRFNGLKEALSNTNRSYSTPITIADTHGNSHTFRVNGLADALKQEAGIETTQKPVQQGDLGIFGIMAMLWCGVMVPIVRWITIAILVMVFWSWGRSFVDESKHSKFGTFFLSTVLSILYFLALLIVPYLILGRVEVWYVVIGSLWAMSRGIKYKVGYFKH